MLRSTGPHVLLALIAGVALAVMTHWNSMLARHSSPLFASWTAHGIGAVAALVLVCLLSRRRAAAGNAPAGARFRPFWAYLGGIPGAFTVLIAAITVNSALGLAGTLALLLIGQMVFGVMADGLGLFGLARRPATPRELIALVLVLSGSLAIIMARG